MQTLNLLCTQGVVKKFVVGGVYTYFIGLKFKQDKLT